MAIIRRELQGRSGVANLFDGICETADDLDSEEAQGWVGGSMMACLNTDTNGKLSFHVKDGEGSWREVIR